MIGWRRRYEMAQNAEKPNLEIGFSVDTEITFSVYNKIVAREIIFFSNGEKVVLHGSAQSGTYVIDAGTSIQAYECTLYYLYAYSASTAQYNSEYIYLKYMEVHMNLNTISCQHLHVENCHLIYSSFYNIGLTDVTILNCTGISAFRTSYGKIQGDVVLDNNPQMTSVAIYDYRSPYLMSINVSNCEKLESVDLTGFNYANYSALKEMTFVNCPNLRTIKSHALSFVTDNEQGLLAFAESLPIIPEGETGTCAIQAIPDGNAKQIIINKGWTIQ